MSEPFDLNGRVAMVTGANTGLGQAIAMALAQAGADIVAVGRTRPDETGVKVRAAGRRFQAIERDLAKTPDTKAVVRDAVKQMGQLDILVNNAGMIRRNDALSFTEEDWDVVMTLNLKTAFFLSQAAARAMLDGPKRGKIINIVSMLSFQGGIRTASYTASKSGLAGLTRLLANEWAPLGININAIAPGYFATNNTTALRDDPDRSQEILRRIPAGRWGDPTDIGGAAVFLASSASDYVHGAILPVDGGWLAR